MNAQEQIDKFQEFLESHYSKELHEAVQKGLHSLTIDFSLLAQNNIELSEDLLENPEDTIKSAEIVVQHMGIDSIDKNFRIRASNLPKSQQTKIRNIRSNHLGKLISFEGLVRQASDVRPQVTSAKFECPACGNTLTLLQLEPTFREPYKCSCGRKGRFRLISKELVDSQRLVIEESPEAMEGGEQPKRLSVFLREDLVEPKMERRTTPGAKIRVTGSIKEVPIPAKSGAPSTRFDLACEANFIEPIEETFEEIDINQEDERKILELAKDPKLYEKLIASFAPSIKGHEDIKGALVLQLMGGVRKHLADGTKVKGDIHVLLVGDPGCIAGGSQVALTYKGMDQIQNLGKVHLQPIREVVTKIRKNAKDKCYDFATKFHYYQNHPALKVVTETGKEVVCTYNQPFLTKEGWKRADTILLGEKIRVMPKIP
ncbi:hypothetical protein HYT58_01245, partial [Candidatus Woesearchaeota archaeon]|nr:hypothetical protein [Candidatus Woesearchaeota archaeon]